MRSKKSVLMTGIVNYECFNGAGSAIAGNNSLYAITLHLTN